MLELLGGDGGRLAVDANGRFDIETALKYGAAMAPYGLRWFEEPGDPLDYALNAEIVRCYPHAVATGENLLSLQDATNLIRHGGLRRSVDYLQFDPALAYGVLETIAITEMMQEQGWSPRRFIPHGGNLLALALTGALNLCGCESYPCRRLPTLRRLRRRHADRRRLRRAARRPGHRFRTQGGAL